MSYLLFIESFGSSNIGDDIGIVLLMATPVLFLIALIFLIVSIARKIEKTKMAKRAVIFFIASGVTALVGLGSCGWF